MSKKDIKRKTKLPAKEIKKVSKDSNLDYLVDTALNKATGGNLDVQTSNFQISFNKILSETHKKEIFQIIEFPTNITVGHLESIRDRLAILVPENMRNHFDVQIVEYSIPNKMSLTDKKLTRIKRSVNSAYRKQIKSINFMKKVLEMGLDTYVPFTEDDIIYAEENLKRRERKKESFKYVLEHKRSGGTYLRHYIFLELTCKTQQELEIASDHLKSLLDQGVNEEPYVYEQLDITIRDYIKQIGMASLVTPTKKEQVLPNMDVTSNIVAITEQYKAGIVRSEYPKIYAGHMLSNNYPHYFSFSESTDAQNLLILADSGSGKTFMAINLAMWALMDKKQYIVFNDYKGGEITNFMKTIKGSVLVSFSLNNPSFVNTYKIPDYELLGYTNPRGAYQLCAHMSASILTTLVNPSDKKRSIVESICDDIVAVTYLQAKVNPMLSQTYELSHNIKFVTDTWEAIKEVTSISPDYKEKYSHDDRIYVKNALSRYFEYEGSKRFLFENEIDLDTVLSSRAIFIDHGMQTTGGSLAKTENEMLVGMLQKFFITNLYDALNKLKGCYTIEIHEEVARQLTDPFTCKQLCNDITGKRSSNKTNILITNTIESLLNPTVNTADINAVNENLNMFMVGRCKPKAAQQFLEYIGQPELEESVFLASQQPTDAYERAFLMVNNTGSASGSNLLSVKLPDSVRTHLMKSRDVDKDGRL